MVSLYLLNSISTRSFLTLVFTSLFLVSLGMISHNVFAMGAQPGSCTNEYDGPFTNATIIVGNQTYYPMKNSVSFQLTNDKGYLLTYTIHTPSQNRQGNSLPGQVIVGTSVNGYFDGYCEGTAYPNSNFTVSGTISHSNGVSPQTSQYVIWGASGNYFSYTVNWVFPGPQTLVASSGNSQISLSWQNSSNNGYSPITNYKIYRSTSSGTETLLATLGNVNSYTDNSVTIGQIYYYYITYVSNFGESATSNEVSATPSTHNTSGDTVTATIQVGNGPTGVAANSDTNKIYVANHRSGTISVIDGSSNSVIATVSSEGDAITTNPATNMIYASSGSAVYVINGSNNNVANTIGISNNGFLGIAVNPNTNKIYVLDNGGIQVIDGSTNSITGSITGWPSNYEPGGVAINPITNTIYVSGGLICCGPGPSQYASKTLFVINGSTNNVMGNVTVGTLPEGITVNPNTNKIYVANFESNSVSVIDGVTNSLVGSITVGTNPQYVAVDPYTDKIYASNIGSNTVSVIDGSSDTVLDTLSVGSWPQGVAVNTNTNVIYVANENSNTVNVINGNTSGTSTVPSSPQNLQTTSGNAQVSLSWSAPSSNGGSPITNYNVYRGTSSGSETLLTAAGNVTSYTDNTVTNGQQYFYKVTAVNSVGESVSSNEASATPTAPTTAPSAPTGLVATMTSSSQINLSWTAPANNGGSAVTGYMIERSTDSGITWSTIVSNTGSTATAYNDTGLVASTTYTYRVSAINSVGTSSPSNTASATTSTTMTTGIALSNTQSTSGTVSSSNTITISSFNVGSDSNRLLVVGVSANNNNVASVTFGGVSLKNIASSFYNNDAEFWYLQNPSGTGDITVTMNGPTQAVVGAYAFSGVNQTTPIPTHVVKHNTSPTSPKISITTKYANDWVLDLPSIYGGSTLSSPTCTQQWDVNVPNAITGASSSIAVPTAGAVTCGWTASSADLYDDAAIEINAASR